MRERYLAVRAVGDGRVGDDGAPSERPVEMRKMLAATGDFPFQGVAELGEVDGGDDEISLAGEMFCNGFGDLGGGGEVDVAIREVDGGAGEAAGLQGGELREG